MTAARRPFQTTPAATMRYGRALRRISRQVSHIVGARAAQATLEAALLTQRDLNRYADVIEGWAIAEAANMLAHVGRENRLDFGRVLNDIAAKAFADWLRDDGLLRSHAGWGTLHRKNVSAIRSIPIVAGERVVRTAQEAMSRAWDPSRWQQAVQETSGITTRRATNMAGDLVSQAEQAITGIRATAIGSPGYEWWTRRDNRVRPSHKVMQGKFVTWGSPPRLIDGTAFHAGCAPGCRCYAVPVF